MRDKYYTKKGIILFLIYQLFILTTHCKLEIANYEQLSPELQDPDLLDIPYSVANFGFSPLGKTMSGNLFESPGLDTQCQNIDPQENKQLQNSFLVIPRGQCTFVTKALHAQQLGARVAIITDNIQHERQIVMKDDGYGYKVTIPAIFINFSYGQKLKNVIQKSQKPIIVRINFQNIKTDKANVTFYMQATNRMAYYLVENFEPFYQKIKDHINWNVVYDIMTCIFCAQDDCYYDGHYCAVHYRHGQSANGHMIMNQQLREKLMFQKHRGQWWKYMQCINQQCNRISELDTCSNTCLSVQTAKALESEFTAAFKANNDSIYFQQDIQNLQYAGINNYPSVTINGYKMRGSLQAQFIFDDICNSLIDPPSSCKYYLKQTGTNTVYQERMYWLTVILVVLLCGIFFTLLFVCCKRFMKKRMTQDMQGRVDDMVSKYIEFYSERNNK